MRSTAFPADATSPRSDGQLRILLAVLALALVTTLLVNTGKGRYAAVTLLPMLFVVSTTMTAGVQMVGWTFPAMYATGQTVKATLCIGLTVFVMASVMTLLVLAASRWVAVWGGMMPGRGDRMESEEVRT